MDSLFARHLFFAWSFAVARRGWWSQCPLAGANCYRPVCLSRDPLVCPLIAGFLGPVARNCVRVEPIYAKDRSLDPLCHRSVWQYSARCLRPFFKFEDSPLGQPALGLAPSWLSPRGINIYQCRGMRRAFNHCCIEYSCFMCRMGSALTLSGLWETPPPGAILSPSMQRGLQVFLFFVSGPAAWQLTRAL